jgi:hypothetical protein
MSHAATAGSMCYEAGHPVDSIATLPDLAAHLTHFVDWYHDNLVVVFFNLLTDQLIDGSSQHFAQNPYGNSHIPDLIGKVLDRDFTAVLSPRPIGKPPPPNKPRGVFDPKHRRP